MNAMIDHEGTAALLSYDPESGALYWRPNPLREFGWNARFAGKAAGCVNGHGYIVTRINGRSQQSHRLAWLLHYGVWPAGQIDHIDGDRTNNRISNLRIATGSQNNANRVVQSNNFLGVKGVYPDRGGKFRAFIMKDKRQHYLGTFAREADARAAYNAAAESLFGEFANPSRGIEA